MRTSQPAFVIRDFPDLGKIRVRLLRTQSASRTATWLDIREFENGPNYMGFTRRGVKLAKIEDVRLLREALETIEREQLFQ